MRDANVLWMTTKSAEPLTSPFGDSCLSDVQALPDVTEVEVNADGWWRPAGVDMPWQSTTVDTAPLSMPKVQIKPDPEQPSDGEMLLTTPACCPIGVIFSSHTQAPSGISVELHAQVFVCLNLCGRA